MPLVTIHHKFGVPQEDIIWSLAKELPEIVAEALNVKGKPEAHLDPGDVEVRISRLGEHDVNTRDVEIIVTANFYLERMANLEEREEMILNAVRDFFADYDFNVSGYVWIDLKLAAFGAL
ncbi:MAG: hypothetical protein LiPW15_146 [Parcubacteria group bacterium LiPW_15]|nr:MAG: hypothetical protein LiPW15_146 [Parcubacteria group bacterium LiPW_15]